MEDNIKTIWDDLSNELFKYINSKVSNVHDAEDILQIVFIKVYNNRNTLTDDIKLRSWIYSITKNSIIDYYRRKKGTLVDISEYEEYLTVGVDENSEESLNEEVSSCINKLMLSMSEEQKEILDLYYNDKISHKEISDKLDISISASKMRLSRAREKLKSTMFNCCEFITDGQGNVLDYERKNEKCCKDNQCK